MKRVVTWAFYAIGAIAITYLALYAYVLLTGRSLQPGEPIRIFRKPDAPSYSAAHSVVVSGFHSGVDRLFLPPKGKEQDSVRPLPRTRDDRCCRRA